MPPNTLATHLNNLQYHNVRHGPYFYPQGNVGFNVWTPSRPGFNHAWHINRLHNGNFWGPTLLQSAMNNPNKRFLLPFNQRLLHNAVSPIQDTYGMMRAGINGRVFQQYPPHLAMWQRYHRTNGGFRYLALSTPPSLQDQLAMLQRRNAPRRAPGQFPFAANAGINTPFDTALNGMPRSTLQRVGDAIGSLLGRRGNDPVGALPIPGFPAGFPRSTPTVRSFPGPERTGPFNGTPENRERAEARNMLTSLHADIQRFVTENSPLMPATQRTIGMLVASIDQALSSPTLSRNHAFSAQMFFQSIVDLDRRERGLPAQSDDSPQPSGGQEAVPEEQISLFIEQAQRAIDSMLAGRTIPPGATPVRIFSQAGKVMIEGDRELLETIARERRGTIRIGSAVERFTNPQGREVLRTVMMDTHNPVDRNRLQTLNSIFRIAGALLGDGNTTR